MIELKEAVWHEANGAVSITDMGIHLKDLYILDNETGEWVDYRLYFEPEAQA